MREAFDSYCAKDLRSKPPESRSGNNRAASQLINGMNLRNQTGVSEGFSPMRSDLWTAESGNQSIYDFIVDFAAFL